MCQDHAFSAESFQRGVVRQDRALSHYRVDADPRPCCPWHIPGGCWREECCDHCPRVPAQSVMARGRGR